jgi:hypothetical protein
VSTADRSPGRWGTRGAEAGVLLPRAGNVLRLPGLPAHPVQAVVLHPSPGATLTGALLRGSVLDCRGEDLDHQRGVVLVSRTRICAA